MQPDATQDATDEIAGAARRNGTYVFGQFRLDPVLQTVTRDGVPFDLSARLFNALAHLVLHHDRVVTRDELAAAVWPARTMEASNIGQAIYTLRKILERDAGGARFLRTIPGRGYQLAIPVLFEAHAVAPDSSERAAEIGTVDRSRTRVGHAPMVAACLLTLMLGVVGQRLFGVASAGIGHAPPGSRRDIERLTIGGTNDPRALDAYLRGMKLRNGHSDDGLRRARDAFGEALAIDRNFVRAEVEEADVLIMGAEGWGAGSSDPADTHGLQTHALAEALDAVAKAPELAEAHAVLGAAYGEVWRFRDQRLELERAHALAPDDARILMAYARLEVDAGHADAAIAAAERAAALNPLAADIYADLAGVLMLARRPEDGLIALRHAAELGFGGTPYADLVARARLMEGAFAEAWQRCAPGEDWFQLVCAAMAGKRVGRDDQAAAALAKLQSRLGETAAYQYARVYAFWGERDAAMHWLDVAYRQRDDGLIDAHADQFLDPLRTLTPFQELEQRLGVAAESGG